MKKWRSVFVILCGSRRVFDSLIFGAVPGTYLGVVYWSAWWWGVCESVCCQFGWYNIIFTGGLIG